MRLAETFGLGAEEAEEATYRMVAGAAKTLHGSGLSPEDVIDLIPVKPLAEDEDAIREIYRSRLSALHRKLKG
jgi:pyrroline-5-carboxylate reductase